MMRPIPLMFVIAVLMHPVNANPQSLGELAKKTAAEREKAKAAADAKNGSESKDAKDGKTSPDAKKTYTDEDLKKLAGTVPGSTTPATAESADAKTADTKSIAPPAKPDTTTSEAAKDEAWWKARAKALDQQTDADTTLLVAAIRHMEGLAGELRPSEISILATARDLHAAEAEVTRLTAVVANDKRAKADLEEDARRADVPPGWLRWR